MLEDISRKGCLKILTNNYIGHLAYVHGNAPYVIPITYYYDATDNAIYSYSGEGHKINAMRLHEAVALQVENIETIDVWESVLVHGSFEELNGSTAKMYLHKFAKAVKDAMSKQKNIDSQSIDSFSNKMGSGKSPIVYRIYIHDIVGRQKKPLPDKSK